MQFSYYPATTSNPAGLKHVGTHQHATFKHGPAQNPVSRAPHLVIAQVSLIVGAFLMFWLCPDYLADWLYIGHHDQHYHPPFGHEDYLYTDHQSDTTTTKSPYPTGISSGPGAPGRPIDYYYNGNVAARFPWNIPDTRPQQCPRLTVESREQVTSRWRKKISVIIPYLAETLEHLEGSIGALLAYTDPRLLKEIILVSDGNKPENVFKMELESLGSGPGDDPFAESSNAPKKLVRVVELPERRGLIYAKVLGAELAQGEVLFFFEPHCLVGRNWLLPLLEFLGENPQALVMPVLDDLDQENWGEYSESAPGQWRYSEGGSVQWIWAGRRSARR